MAAITLWGCKKEKGPAGKNSLIAQLPEPASEHCMSGGLRVISGLDENRNNVLDSNEVQKTEYVCNAVYNKETILQFPGSGYGYTSGSTTGTISFNTAISNFNITNYPADSISFSSLIYTTDASSKAFIELFDETNNKVIPNTTLSTNSTSYELKTTTVNFLKDMPKMPITLNFRVRIEKTAANLAAVIYLPVLKIYKK
jgi:hypothetical protein